VFLGTALVDPTRLGLLLVPVSFLVVAFAAGTLVDRAVGGLLTAPDRSPMLGLAVRVGVGLACLSLLAVASAFCGVFWIAGVTALPLLAYGLLQLIRAGFRFPPAHEILPAAVGGLAMGSAWLVAWLWATVPPTFFDELGYHLVIPQHALATGQLQTAPWVFFTLMPHASDLLMAWGMAIGGELGARATLFALWVACSLGAWGLAEAIAWPQRAPWAAALVAGALAASPTLWFLATLPFAETTLASAVVTAAALLVASHAGRRPWIPFGLVLGLVATVKLAGLYWIMAMLAAALVIGWPRRAVFQSMLIVLMALAPWWTRAYMHTGNPVYPLAYSLLGGSPWSEESQAKVQGDLPSGIGSWMDLMRLPVDLVQHPERFGSASDAGILAMAVPCLVVILPVIARVIGSRAEERRMCDAAAVFVLVAGACWVVSSPTTRFFAPAMVLGLAVLVGVVLRLGRTVQAAMGIVIVTLGIWGTVRFIDQHSTVFSSFAVALGQENARDYLARQLDHYGAASFVREKLPADVRILFIGETRPYYFAREAMAPSAYDRHPLHRWIMESSSPEALAARLDAEGFTHVVLNVHEFKRLHDRYRVLAFTGEGAEENDRRLKALPQVLRLVFSEKGIYVFEVPHGSVGRRQRTT
jgi:hypothetical protein